MPPVNIVPHLLETWPHARHSMTQYVHAEMLHTPAIWAQDPALSGGMKLVSPTLSLPDLLPRPPPAVCKGDGSGQSAGIQ